jgi:intein-encoded DNA endonuclease-like protein
MPLIKIANIIGYKSKDIVYKILKENNICKRRSVKRKLNENEEKEIISLYNSGLSQYKISSMYGVSQSTIGNILRNNNVNTRKDGRIYTINERYFDNIDNQNKAYILGFIYADGFIRKDNLALSIVVHNKDVEILEKIKAELQSDIPIEYIKSKNHNRINICSKNICLSLNKIGCNNGKTFDLKFPNIQNDLIPHFIRGYMDGDGCISISNKKYGKYISLSFTGTKDMMDSFKNLLNVDNKITFHRNAYALHIGKERDVIRILDWIYKDAKLYLNRKYEKYIEFKRYKNRK